MAIAVTVAGTVASASSGNITPGLPSGWAAGDIHCLIVMSSDNVAITLPANWVIKSATNNGASERVTFAYKRAVAGDTNPLVTHTAGAAIIGRIAGFRGAIATGDPFEAGAAQANASSATISAAALTTLTANCMIVFAGGSAAEGTVSGYSGTNPVFTEIIDSTFAGEDNTICMAYGIKTDISTTGARTATNTGAAVNVGTMWAMTEAASATVLPPNEMFIMQAVRHSASW